MSVRMIAADMDGTLLDTSMRLSEELIPIIRRLKAINVHFVVSSGRQYFNLERLFAPVADELYFCSENGSIIFEGARNIYANVISPDNLISLLDFLRPYPQLHVVFCGVKAGYFEPCSLAMEKEIRKYYEVYEVVPDLKHALAVDEICKVAVYDELDAEHDFYPKLRELNHKFSSNLSGKHWLDIMNKGCNKGLAIKILQEKLQIKPEECMAFGDYLNDCELLENCYYSYAMANAHPGLFKYAKYRAPSNQENGVCTVLKEFFNL